MKMKNTFSKSKNSEKRELNLRERFKISRKNKIRISRYLRMNSIIILVKQNRQ